MSGSGTRTRGLESAEQAELYRRWMISAALTSAEAEGLHSVTVARVTAGARVSRKVFYDTFSDVEDCIHAALELLLESAAARIAAAYGSRENWRDGVRAALEVLFALADRHRGLARVCVLESLAGGPRLRALRRRALTSAGEAIERAALGAGARRPSPLTAEALPGAIAELLHARLEAGGPEPLSELTAPCMAIIVLPYLGARAAREELARRPGSADGLHECALPPRRTPAGSGLRVTYRTVRVLSAIAEHPGACNRAIARRAGISDQGQTSKLLKRLAARRLIENTASDHSANAWWLTDLGREFVAQLGAR